MFFFSFLTFCVCMKRMCSSSPSSHFSASLIRNMGEFGAKRYFTDHQKTHTIQLFVFIKRKFFGSILFYIKSQQMGIPQRLFDKHNHLLICTLLKQTSSSKQKPVYTVKILVSEEMAFAAVLHYGQVFVFCKLNKKSVLEWFLLILSK